MTNLSSEELFSSEYVLLSKPANLLIDVARYDLDATIGRSRLVSAIGLEKAEALGGMLHLTNYRIAFKTHDLNRVTGLLSLPLHTIVQLEDRSRFLLKKLAIITSGDRFEFIVWQIAALIAEVRKAVRNVRPEQEREFGELAARMPAKLGRLTKSPYLATDLR